MVQRRPLPKNDYVAGAEERRERHSANQYAYAGNPKSQGEGSITENRLCLLQWRRESDGRTGSPACLLPRDEKGRCETISISRSASHVRHSPCASRRGYLYRSKTRAVEDHADGHALCASLPGEFARWYRDS